MALGTSQQRDCCGILCHNSRIWHLAIAVSFEVPDAARRTTTYIADHHSGRRHGWSSATAGPDL